MIDASTSPFEENITLTKKVVEYAILTAWWSRRSLDSWAVSKSTSSAWMMSSKHLTDPNQVVEFVKKTGCDSLAVAVGTSHGAYKFKTEPKLAFDRIKEIAESCRVFRW